MTSLMSGYYDSVVSSRPSIGDTKLSTISSDHNGWLICNGRELPIADYKSLFSVIGYQFGGEGSMFKLPDPAGRVPGIIGSGESLTERQRGDIVGEETHTLDISEIPIHKHDASSNATGVTTTSAGAHNHTINDPGHAHTQTTVQDDYNGSSGGSAAFTTDSGNRVDTHSNISEETTGITLDPSGSHTHPINDPTHTHSISTTGGSQPHNNMQPTLFMGNMFIYNGVPKYGMSSAGGYNWF